MNNDLMFSSKTDQWATPNDFFVGLNREFNFDLDPCADGYNHKCEKYYTKEDNGLSQNWGGTGCFAIRLMVKKSAYGLRKHTKKDTRKILLYAC